MRASIVHSDPNEPKVALVAQALHKLNCEVAWANTLEDAVKEASMRQASRSLVIVPAAPLTKIDVGSVIADAKKLAGRAFVLYVADEISPSDYKSLLRVGAADSTDWKSVIKDVTAIVNRLRNQDAEQEHHQSDPSRHCVATFVGTGGGPGNTTLALEVGVALSTLKGEEARSVALFDLDFYNSMMCDYLDLTPRVDFDALAHDPHRLDDYMLEIFVSKHSSGLHVFSPRQPVNVAAADNSVVFQLLNKLLDRYDIVLIDLPHHRFEGSEEILRNSDGVFVTGLFSVPAVHRIRLVLQRLQKFGVPSEHMAAVLTDVDTGFLGRTVKRFSVDNLLGDLPVFYIRRDRAFAMECADAGQSMVETQPSRAICSDIKSIAQHLVSIAPAPVMA